MGQTGEAPRAIEALSARLRALEETCARLGRENAELQRSIASAGPARASGGAALASPGVSRRRLLRTTVGVAATAAAGAVALDRAAPARATDGSSLVIGSETTGESCTELHYDGSAPPGLLFLVTDQTSSSPGTSAYTAPLGGWANGTVFSNGVYGLTSASGGAGVVGQLASGASSGQGVLGVSSAAGSAGTMGHNLGGGTGVTAVSKSGYGLQAQGGKAPLRLVPAASAGAPRSGSHARGELFLDKNGALFLCTASGTPGTWKTVQVR